jgi:hypothetical protein
MQHHARLEEVLKHALAAELDASCGGRGKLVVPASWKWKLLHEVNELETAFEHTHGSSRDAGQHTREPFSYRLWLMVHTGLQHVTHADTLLELQLVIHNSGATLLRLIDIVIFDYLPTNPFASAGVANVREQRLQHICSLLPAVCFSSACSCLSVVWCQSQCSCVAANFCLNPRGWDQTGLGWSSAVAFRYNDRNGGTANRASLHRETVRMRAEVSCDMVLVRTLTQFDVVCTVSQRAGPAGVATAARLACSCSASRDCHNYGCESGCDE